LARSAPPGFGILQLFNSNEGSMESTWNIYLQSRNLKSRNIETDHLWIRRKAMKYFDFW
jgi:hypothetical protein